MNNDATFNTNPKNDCLSFALSVALHGIVFLLLCYLPTPHSTPKQKVHKPYSVTLDLASFARSKQQSSQTPTSAAQPATNTSPQHSITTSNDNIPEKDDIPQPEEQLSHTKEPEECCDTQQTEESCHVTPAHHEPTAPSAAEPTIDTRGLYTGDKDGDDNQKQASASLELPGWIWDAVPEPMDDTAEGGKIVFKITIDTTGEVIGIETLETTISPILEQRYKNAVANLTFSKTSTEWQYTNTSVGKITFLLQYA